MNTPLAYLNGRLLPFGEAGLPLHDAGFVSGATVVDNARTFRHKLFRWPDHLARFRRDCAACYVPLEASDEQLRELAMLKALLDRDRQLLIDWIKATNVDDNPAKYEAFQAGWLFLLVDFASSRLEQLSDQV